jgi:hypothetical protein
MDKNILLSGFCSLIHMFYNRACPLKDLLFKGLVVFLITFFGLVCIDKVHSFEIFPCYKTDTKKIIEDIFDIECLSIAERESFKQKIVYHKNQADEYTNLASGLCWALPRKTDRDKSVWCWVTFIASVSQGTPQSKVISGLLAFFCQYGIDCIHEWNDIKTYLNHAEYHYGMKEFYETVLKKG